MILTIDKKKFNWNDSKTIHKKHKQKLNINRSNNSDKFDDYLSDNMSDESESVKNFLSHNLNKYN